MTEKIALILSILSFGGVVYLILLNKKPLFPKHGNKFAEVPEGEMNVTTKIIGNKRFLVDEKGEILDKKRIEI